MNQICGVRSKITQGAVMKKNCLKWATAFLALAGQLSAYTPTNFNMPFDAYLWRTGRFTYLNNEDDRRCKLSVFSSLEYGFDAEGRDHENSKVSPFKIFSPSEPLDGIVAGLPFDAQLSALLNMAPATPITNTAGNIDKSLVPKANLHETDYVFGATLSLPISAIPGEIALHVYVPFKKLSVHNAGWNSVTNPSLPHTGMSDQPISTLLEDFKRLSGLNPYDYSDTKMGDIAAIASWKNRYSQVNETLSSVDLYAHAGFMLNSSKALNHNEVFALPFGNDHAIAFPLAASLGLNVQENLRIEGGVDFMPSLGETSQRRFRTILGQGNLLLAKTFRVHRTPGHLLRFNVSTTLTSSCKRFVGSLGYQFGRTGDDEFTSAAVGEGFNKQLADTDGRYKSRNWHTLKLRTMFICNDMENSKYEPYICAIFKLPLRAKNMIVFKTFTFEGGLRF